MASAFIGLLDFVLEGVNKAKIHGFFEDGVVSVFFFFFCYSVGPLCFFFSSELRLFWIAERDSSRTE